MSAFCPEGCPDTDACVVGHPCALFPDLAPDALKVRVGALAAEWEQGARYASHEVARRMYGEFAGRLRALLEG